MLCTLLVQYKCFHLFSRLLSCLTPQAPWQQYEEIYVPNLQERGQCHYVRRVGTNSPDVYEPT